MKREQLLPVELVWQDDGHVGDVALAAIADGELEIVPAQARAHTQACDDCSARLGEQALLSATTSEALELAAPGFEQAPARRPLPMLAVVFALALAALGAAPTLVGLIGGLASAPEIALRSLFLAARAAAALVRTVAGAEAGSWAVAWTAATAVLLLLGALVAHAARSRQETA
jgi:hypothetical protein